MVANISNPPAEEELARFLTVISQSSRIKILFVLSTHEACVCHLEAALGMRQASISQHLMVLKKAGVVTAHREQRNIFYRLVNPDLIPWIGQLAFLAEIDAESLRQLSVRPIPGCCCPQCNPGMDPRLACRVPNKPIS